MRTLLAICLSALVCSCGKSDPASPVNNSTPPTLPAAAALQVPRIGNAGSPFVSAGDNFNAALLEAAYWTDTAAASMAVAGSLLGAAQAATPVAKAGSWEWALTSGANTGTLTATRGNDTVAWTLTILGPSAINYLTGSSSTEGDSGIWVLHEPGPIPSFRISYSMSAVAPDTITFTAIKVGDPRKDSYLRFVTSDGDQRQAVVRRSEIPSLATITWSQATGAGTFTTNVLPGATFCWGAQSTGYPNLSPCP